MVAFQAVATALAVEATVVVVVRAPEMREMAAVVERALPSIG